MKHPHHTTPDANVPTLAEIGRWSVRLRHVHERLRPYFARPEPLHHALLYLQAIISDIPRKNGWQIAEHARQLRPYGMQRLLSQAVWDARRRSRGTAGLGLPDVEAAPTLASVRWG